MKIIKLLMPAIFFNLFMLPFFAILYFGGAAEDYVSEGSLVLRDDVKDVKILTYVGANDSFEVISIGESHIEFYRQIYSRTFNGYRFYNLSDSAAPKGSMYGDERLVFNYLYSVRNGTGLTVKRFFNSNGSACFYIFELKKIRCVKS